MTVVCEKLSFHQATMEDADGIYHQCKALIDRYEDISAIDYRKVLQWLREKIQKDISQYTRICYHDETVGYFRLYASGCETELDDFYILPPYRGQGIGTAVLTSCIQQTDTPIFLYVFKENHEAIRLYKRFGFVHAEDVSATRMILRRYG